MKNKNYGIYRIYPFSNPLISTEIIHETKACWILHHFYKWEQTFENCWLPLHGWAPLGHSPWVLPPLKPSGKHDACAWQTLRKHVASFKRNGPLQKILQMKAKLKGEKVRESVFKFDKKKTPKNPSKVLECFQHFISNFMSRKFP